MMKGSEKSMTLEQHGDDFFVEGDRSHVMGLTDRFREKQRSCEESHIGHRMMSTKGCMAPRSRASAKTLFQNWRRQLLHSTD